MTDIDGKYVLVTGAASGIGKATARLAAERSAKLVLTDVRDLSDTVAAIRGAGGTVAYSQSLDISDFDAVRRFADAVHAEVGSMDVVMNIAGVAAWGSVSGLEHHHWQRMIDVNLMGPIHVIETFIPPMIKARRGGHLVNVSSAAGLIGMPWHAAYSASKFGLRGVSEVLRFDLRRHKIKVTLVVPGAVDTGLVETLEIAGLDKSKKRMSKYQARFRKRAKSSEEAAIAILKGVRRDTYLVHTSHEIRLAAAAQRYFPPGYELAMRTLNRIANRALPEVDRGPRR